MDIDVVREGVQSAVDRARSGGGPTFIEAKTYRHGGHSRADPGKYRPDDEVAAWMERDPIILYRARLEELGIDSDRLDRIESDATAEVDEATEVTKAAPPPHPDTLATNVWADGGSAWRN